MLVLGIETSCDETAAALVDDADGRWAIRSNVVASQVDIHREWGGVVPELASRQHVRDICGVVERALADGNAGWADVDALAVTQGPGLVGSLLVGVSFAKSAAWALGKPLVAVNHLAGHIESIWLEHGPIALPAVVLVVSGGHTSLYLVRREGDYALLGRTRDDAAGEAYDKVAKLLGLGYPGRTDHRSTGAAGQRCRDSVARDAADQSRSQCARARRPIRFQLQRPQDRGAAARARNGKPRWAPSSCLEKKSSTSPRASSDGWSRR